MEKLLYTPIEVAACLGVGRNTVYELIAAGRLQSVKIGRCRRVARAQLDAFVASLSAEQAA